MTDAPHRNSEGPSATDGNQVGRPTDVMDGLWEAVFESSRDALFLSDEHACFTAVNQAACELTGYSRGELLAMRIPDLHDDGDLTPFRELHHRILAGEPALSRAAIRRKDGVKVEVEFSSCVATMAGRKLMHTTARDITARATAETALRRSQARYRELVENLNDVVYAIDLDGRLTYLSPAVTSVLGYSVDEIVGRFYIELIHPDDTESILRASQEVFAGRLGPREYRVRHRDGSYRWVRTSSRALVEDDVVVGLQGVLTDITERRRAEETLRHTSAMLETVFESAPVAIFTIDAENRVGLWNRGAEMVFGWSASEVRGELLPIVQADKSLEFEQLKRQFLEGASFLALELERIRRDGSPVRLRLSVAPLRDQSGGVDAVLAVAADVTEQVRAEEQLRHAQKIEAVGLLAGGVAHDFNNLLQVLQSNTQLVRSFAAQPDRVRKIADELEEQALRGAALVRQLLLFARREIVCRQQLDLNQVIRDDAAFLRRMIRENIALELDLAPMPLLVEADRGQLSQVLMNLALNASDELELGGDITIRSGTDDGTVWLAVEDDGPGVPVELRSRIFEPFFTTKPVDKGTGLGLSVVQGIVDQHGGSIRVDSRPGGGSVFRVVLPEMRQPLEGEPPGVSRLATSHSGDGRRILIVEDEPAVREALISLLELLGYETTAVGTAEEAGALPDAPFVAALVDLTLPGKPGHKLADDLRGRWPGIAVVLMSGYSTEDVVRRGVVDGTVPFLQKPFNSVQLENTLQRVLDS